MNREQGGGGIYCVRSNWESPHRASETSRGALRDSALVWRSLIKHNQGIWYEILLISQNNLILCVVLFVQFNYKGNLPRRSTSVKLHNVRLFREDFFGNNKNLRLCTNLLKASVRYLCNTVQFSAHLNKKLFNIREVPEGWYIYPSSKNRPRRTAF